MAHLQCEEKKTGLPSVGVVRTTVFWLLFKAAGEAEQVWHISIIKRKQFERLSRVIATGYLQHHKKKQPFWNLPDYYWDKILSELRPIEFNTCLKQVDSPSPKVLHIGTLNLGVSPRKSNSLQSKHEEGARLHFSLIEFNEALIKFNWFPPPIQVKCFELFDWD